VIDVRTRLAAVERLRGLVEARAVIDDAVRQAAQECVEAGVDSLSVAGALGVSRAQLYRLFPGGRGAVKRGISERSERPS
jgi:hypothetical protein